MMTLSQIKRAVDEGTPVYWSNKGYTVIKNSRTGDYLIKHTGGHCIGLTWADGQTMNGREEEFFVDKPVAQQIASIEDEVDEMTREEVEAKYQSIMGYSPFPEEDDETEDDVRERLVDLMKHEEWRDKQARPNEW